MKNALRWTLSLTFLALVGVSCQQAADTPTAPSTPAGQADDGDGTVTAMAGPSTGGGAGPSGGGGAGPTTGGAGPGTTGTTPGGGGSGGGGGGGLPGGGGGGSGGGGGGTGGGGGGALPCPPTYTMEAQGTPMLFTDATDAFQSLFPDDPAVYEDCFVKEVKVIVYLTTVTGYSAPDDDPSLFIQSCGTGFFPTGDGFLGCEGTSVFRFTSSNPASGNVIGTNCGSLSFDTASPTPFDEATVSPPYVGIYQMDPTHENIGLAYRITDLYYDFQGSGHPPDTVLECARIVIETQPSPF